MGTDGRRTHGKDPMAPTRQSHELAGAGVSRSAPPPVPAPPRGRHDGWHRVPLASLDLEATGIDPLLDRVVSYALLDLPGSERSGLVQPGIAVPEAAAQVHGLTTALLAEAPAAPDALASVLAWVADLVERRVGLVVFNAGYDLTMLRAEARRHGLVEPDWSRLLVVDPFVLDWGVDREAARPRRLVDVAEHYGVALHEAHDAVKNPHRDRHRRRRGVRRGVADGLAGDAVDQLLPLDRHVVPHVQ